MGNPTEKLREMYEREKARADAAEANALAVAQERLEERAHRERDGDAQKKALAAANARAEKAISGIVDEQRRFGEMQREAWKLEEALAAARRECEGLRTLLQEFVAAHLDFGKLGRARDKARAALAAPAAGEEGKR